MAVDIHIKIDTIPGMSEHKDFAGQIMCESFSWHDPDDEFRVEHGRRRGPGEHG